MATYRRVMLKRDDSSSKFDFTDEDRAKIYALPFETTKHSADCWFQISINHKMLVTNKILHNMKMRNDALCYYCHSCDESINHQF